MLGIKNSLLASFGLSDSFCTLKPMRTLVQVRQTAAFSQMNWVAECSECLRAGLGASLRGSSRSSKSPVMRLSCSSFAVWICSVWTSVSSALERCLLIYSLSLESGPSCREGFGWSRLNNLKKAVR